MRLEDLANQPIEIRNGLSKIIVNDPQYLQSLEAGSRFFSFNELEQIEKQNQDQGLTFKQIQEVMATKGITLKPPTFKKYVGMKLVSGTLKIQKTEKGFVGFYPTKVVRQINLIKYLLETQRDFFGCYFEALAATPCSALQIVQSSDPDVLDIVENLAEFKAYDEVKYHLEDLLGKKLITVAEKENVLSLAREFESACNMVYDACDALQIALQDLKVPGSYNLEKMLEATKKRLSGETKGSQPK